MNFPRFLPLHYAQPKRIRPDPHSPFSVLRSPFLIFEERGTLQNPERRSGDGIKPMTSIQKSLDQKLTRIHADPWGAKDFILADAKDADMALSIGAPGRSPEAHGGKSKYRSLQEF